jgi:hypothetical protein
MKMEPVNYYETVVRIDTVSKPDSLGAYLHPALIRPCFVPVMHLAMESSVQHDCFRWRCADVCCVCIYRGWEILESPQGATR